jgi:anaerobic ribonucleoside-triphosphate reductase
MTTEQYDRHIAFIGDKTGIVLCGECVVEGCEPADIGPFTCEICGNSYPFDPGPKRVPWWRRVMHRVR